MEIEVKRNSKGEYTSFLDGQEVKEKNTYAWNGRWVCPCCGSVEGVDVSDSYEEDNWYHWSCYCADCDAKFSYWSELMPKEVTVELLGKVNPVDLAQKRYEDKRKYYEVTRNAGVFLRPEWSQEQEQQARQRHEERLRDLELEVQELHKQIALAEEKEGIARQQAWTRGEFMEPEQAEQAEQAPAQAEQAPAQAEQAVTVPEVSLGDMIRSAERGAGEVAARSLSEEQRRILMLSMMT